MRTRAIALMLVTLFLASCGAFKVVKPPDPAPSGPLKGVRFEGGKPGDKPAGWLVISHTEGQDGGLAVGSSPRFDPTEEEPKPDHKLELTDSDKHSGEMSAVLGPIGKKKLPKERFGNARICGDPPFGGSAFRVSAFLKADSADIATSMFVTLTEPESDLRTQRVSKTAGKWTKFEAIILPGGTAGQPAASPGRRPEVCVNFGVARSGRLWIDDIAFAKIDLAALPPEKVQAVALDNLDMERFERSGAIPGWNLRPSELPARSVMRSDTKIKRSGAASLRFSAEQVGETKFGDNVYYVADPAPFLGKTIRVGAWIRAELGEGGYIAFSVFAGLSTLEELMAMTPEQIMAQESSNSDVHFGNSGAAFDWVRHEQTLFVPRSTRSLAIQFRLDPVGEIWVDDLTVEVIDR
ncbi:MAG TPA: hypothetical protein VND22_05605 [Actinomycetota bacterium]|nr:hypothetical protein [Actinomycetota bacterium]